ncbi:MAG: hypothetical protein ACFBWO_06995 [Paracoccaceae bacterium]
MHPADALFETREAIRRLRRQEAWLRAQVVAARTDRRGAAWEAVVGERRRRTAGPEDGPRLGAGAFWRERLERRVVLRPVGGADGQAGPAK